MPIKLNGATSGSVELDVPAAVGSDLQLTLPTTAGTLDRLERAGNILQVVQGSTSTLVSNTTQTYVDTGLSATIVPTSATSKILVNVYQTLQYYRSASANGVGIQILRGSTVISHPCTNNQGGLTDYIATNSTVLNRYMTYALTILDSPGTANSVTYKAQGRPYLNPDSGLASFQPGGTAHNGTSYIQLIEVAA